MPNSDKKTCVICASDCSERPRIRNQRGQYACKACIDAKRGAQSQQTEPRIGQELLDEPVRPSGRSPSRPASTPEPEIDLAAAITAAATHEIAVGGDDPAMRVMKDCPVCGSVVKDDQVICLVCGADIARGKKSKVRVFERADNEPPQKASLIRLAAASALGVAGAGIGAGIWVTASASTGEPLSSLVFLVGALSGGLALIPLLGDGTRVSGIVCAIAALVACGIGLSAAPEDANEPFDWTVVVDYTGTEVTYEVLPLDESQRAIFLAVWASLGALTAFSIGSSSPFDREDWDEEEDGA